MHGSIALLVIGVAIAAAVTGLWAYLRSTAPKRAARGERKSSAKVKQWGVRIAARDKERTCPPVRSFLGKEFRMADKPRLPLADCPYPHRCECHYVPLMDRRKSQRRSGEDRRGDQRFEKDNPPRRSGKDRRVADVEWEARDRNDRE